VEAPGPTAGEALMWLLAIAIVAMLVIALVSLSRSPLEPARRIPWAFAMFLLPVIGPGVWVWWRFSDSPQRRAEQPDWAPTRRGVTVNPPRRPGAR